MMNPRIVTNGEVYHGDPKVRKILGTPGSFAADPDPNYLSLSLIQRGSRGRDVEFCQHMLYIFMPDYAYDLVADGIFGEQTENYVKMFQQYNGLTADGVVGSNTWNRLAPTVDGNYNYWRKAYGIRYVQYLLILGGRLASGQDDGLWGWRTENAIKDFQNAYKNYGVIVDGKWGKQCWSITFQGYL